MKASDLIESKQPGVLQSALNSAQGRRAPQLQAIETAFLIPLDRIEAGPQPRVNFDRPEDASLTNSIYELRARGGGIMGTGILQPITVVRHRLRENWFIVTVGGSRFRAAQELGLPFIPAIISDSDKAESYVEGIIENLQRHDMTPIEYAHAFRQAMEADNLSKTALAKRIGASLGYVVNRLNLLDVATDVKEMAMQRPDTMVVAGLIDGVKNTRVRRELISDVKRGASVRSVKEKIAKAARGGVIPSRTYGSPAPNASRLPAVSYDDATFQAVSFVEQLARIIHDTPPRSEKKAAIREAIAAMRAQLDSIEAQLSGKGREIGED